MGHTFLRAIVYYSGRVQNVGFRYTVYQVAKGFEVAGFVRNLADGRVHLEAEGGEGEVREFLAAIANKMDGFIRKTESVEQRGSAVHSGFMIR